MIVLLPSSVYPPHMPLMSAVGRAQIRSSPATPFSPDGAESPMPRRNSVSLKPSASHSARCSAETAFTES